MALQPLTANQADFQFRLADHPDADLRVAEFHAEECLSSLYSVRIELISHSFSFQPEELLGKRATLQLHRPDGARCIHGIIWRFAKLGERNDLLCYEAELVPEHQLLRKRYQSRVFEPARCDDMTVPGIVRKVFEEAGLPEDLYHFAIQNKYPRPDFVAQYQESDWDFVNRLLEQEGIHYFFEHHEDSYRMVISDEPASFRQADDPQIPFRTPSGLQAQDMHISAVQTEQTTQHGSVTLDDYTFRDPIHDLRSTVENSEHTALLRYEYPANFELKSEGQRYAVIRMQQQQSLVQRVHFETNTRGLQPGTCFQLSEHPDPALNRDYLVLKLEHSGAQPQNAESDATSGDNTRYNVRVTTIRTDVRYRPPQQTAIPTVAGSQTALVVGPESEEIHTDEYGRVRVQFHWDQTGTYSEGSSAWIRVSQGLAGGGYGMMFLPRVGQEVIVDFLEGNPNRPIITGRVYNKDHMPPYQLPQHKNRSTIKTRTTKGGGGSNEIRFEDTKDGEQLLLHGQRDLHLRAGNDRQESIGRDRHLEVGRDQRESFGRSVDRTIGKDRSEQVAGDQSLQVDGMVTVQVGGTRSLTVSGDVVEDLQSSYKQTVTGTSALQADKLRLEATSTIELKCGGSSIVLTPGAIYIQGGPIVHINGGAGPSVGLPGATATKPATPEKPLPADEVEHGTDTRYGGGTAVRQEPVTPTPEEVDEGPNDSWIEVELVDEDEQPVPSARFEVRTPDGQTRTGRTNANGVARISGIQPGNCEICFPDLDAECWEKL